MALRVLLWHDGSMTKALEALTNESVSVDVQRVTYSENRVLRDVLLKAGSVPLVVASSVWPQERYTEVMGSSERLPIGKNLNNKRLEQFREIHYVDQVECDTKLSELLGDELGTMLNRRNYTIYQDQRVLTTITEIFSNKVKSYLSDEII